MSDEHTHDWLNEREMYDDRPSRSEVEEYRGTIPPYDQPPCDEDMEERDEELLRQDAVAAATSKEARFRAVLQHLATPNRGARATGRDALDMAEYARQQLEEIDGPEDHPF